MIIYVRYRLQSGLCMVYGNRRIQIHHPQDCHKNHLVLLRSEGNIERRSLCVILSLSSYYLPKINCEFVIHPKTPNLASYRVSIFRRR